jgi:K+-transporting ATPase ATPase C chain
MLKELKPAFAMLLGLTVLTGVAYPLLVTGIAQGVFPDAANGSLIEQNGKVIGSALIGQPFSDPKYFWGRPSATGPVPCNAAASSGSNQGPLNPALEAAVKARIEALKSADPTQTAPIPVDLVTASASGLDPEISPASAEWQAPRIARLRGLSSDAVRELIAQHTQARQLGVLGEPRVNVLRLNLALDRIPRPYSNQAARSLSGFPTYARERWKRHVCSLDLSLTKRSIRSCRIARMRAGRSGRNKQKM